MKKVIAIAVALSALGTAQVFAQAKNFEGFTMGANLEFDNGKMNATDGSSGNGHKTGLGLQAQYNWAMNNQWLIGMGIGTSTGHRNAGTYASGVGAYTKDRDSLDLMPGYAIDNKLMVFGKLSSITAKALSDDGVSTATAHGTGYGIGLRGLIDNHTYWQAGLDTHRYRNVAFATGTASSLKDNVLSLGVGYKF